MQVEVTLLNVDGLAPDLDRLGAVLSPDERARAARFHFERDRTRFTLGRAALRHTLAVRLDATPESLRFTYGPQGKPALEDQPLGFNASGADGLVAIAVARGAALGIDVERPRAKTDWPAIARRFFAQSEQDELFSLPEARQENGFLRAWTLKEAVVKFTGRGLGLGLDSFAVSLAPEDGPEIAAWSSDLTPPGALWTRPLAGGAHVSLACGAPEIAVVAGRPGMVLADGTVPWPTS